MMVIDASVLVAASVDTGPEGVWAEERVARGELFAPQLVLVEAASVLRRLEMGGALSALEATTAHQELLALDMELLPYPPFASRIWSLRWAVSSYDAWYVAIAEAFDVPLATLDRRLARATGPACRFELPP